MSQTADIQHEVHPLIEKRWSPRAFLEKPVEVKKLKQIFEAARWAASCFNEQPWRFILGVKEDASTYEKLLDCLVEANQVWARQAPVLVLSIAKLDFTKNQKPNRHAAHDVGLAVANLVVQATELGLHAHQMAGFSIDKATSHFSIPQNYEPMAAIAIGYLGEHKKLPEVLQERELAPRQRISLQDMVFGNHWGQGFW